MNVGAISRLHFAPVIVSALVVALWLPACDPPADEPNNSEIDIDAATKELEKSVDKKRRQADERIESANSDAGSPTR